MTNRTKIQEALKHLNTSTLRVSVGILGGITFHARGTSKDSAQSAIDARRAAAHIILEMYSARKVSKIRKGGGTYWKGFELDCDCIPNETVAGLRIAVTQEEKQDLATRGGAW